MRPPRATILAARGLPHHAGPAARVAEGLDQRLDRLAGPGGRPPQAQRAPDAVHDGGEQVEALDALRRPIGRNLVARHAPHLLGVGLEEDGEELLAEIVADPGVEGLRCRDGPRLGPEIGAHAGRTGERPEVAQGFEGLERIAVELAAIEDARQPRPLDEIVRQDLVPEIDDLARLGEEAVAADVEEVVLVVHRPADAADGVGVAFDHADVAPRLGQQVAGRQSGGAGADDQDLGVGTHAGVLGGRGQASWKEKRRCPAKDTTAAAAAPTRRARSAGSAGSAATRPRNSP